MLTRDLFGPFQRKLGRVDFRFQTPFSLRDFVASYHQSHPVPQGTVPFMARDNEMALLKSLAYRVFSDSKATVDAVVTFLMMCTLLVNAVSSVVPAAAVAAILLSNRGLVCDIGNQIQIPC